MSPSTHAFSVLKYPGTLILRYSGTQVPQSSFPDRNDTVYATGVPTSVGMSENEASRKRTSSLNDSEEGSPEPGSQSPTHTPPLTPALTPQREDTPAPENLSLRKSGSPQQTQHSLQPVDLVQPRPSPPLPSLAVSPHPSIASAVFPSNSRPIAGSSCSLIVESL